jgi:hypothetical protein
MLRVSEAETPLLKLDQHHPAFVLTISYLGPICFILNINGVLDLFENMSVLGYADDLKHFMAIKCFGDCRLFQRDLERLGEWCRSNKSKGLMISKTLE